MPLVTRLDRYVLRTFAASFVPVAAAFLVIFVVADGFTRLDKFLKSGEPLLTTIARYYAAMLPALYVRFGPFVTLAAGMFAVARLQRNNELMPMLAGGIPVGRALAPVFFCGALLGLVEAADVELLLPRIAPSVRAAMNFQKQSDVKPGIVRDRDGNTLFAAIYRPASRTLSWVTFRERSPDGRERSIVWADRGAYLGAEGRLGIWRLEDGIVREPLPAAPSGTASQGGAAGGASLPLGAPRFEQRAFGSGDDAITVRTSIQPIDLESLGEATSLLSFEELREQHRRQRYLVKLRVQLHARITGPLAHLILLLLGLPFVLRPDGGRAASIFFGALALIGIAAAYFVATFVSHSLGADGVIDPLVAAWAPVTIFGLAGIKAFGDVRT